MDTRAATARRAVRARVGVVAALALAATAAFGLNPLGADATNGTAAPTAVATFTHTKTEPFSTKGWWKTWGLTTAPWHTAVVADGTNLFLRVTFPAGSHNGSSFEWPTDTADAAHIQYRVRFSENWLSHGGKLPGFGEPTYSSEDGTCLGGCGLVPADGITSWSARGHFDGSNIPGSYLYTPDQSAWGINWATAPLEPGRWYTIDYWVTMNTPGVHDGELRAAVDGVQVLDWTDLLFRQVDTLHVGKAWFGFYYGGSSVPDETMWIDIDDVLIEW